MEIVLVTCLGVVCFLSVTVAIVVKPWQTLLAFGVFLLFQDYVVTVLSNPVLKQLVKSSDEFFIWYFFLLSILFSSKKQFITFDYLAIGLLFVGLVSSYLNTVQFIVVVSDIILMLKFYALFRGVTLQNFDPMKFVFLNRLVFTAGMVLFLIGILEVIFPDQIKSLMWGKALASITVDERFGITSVNAIFVHPGSYGWFMGMCAAVAIAQYLVLHNKKYLFLFGLFMIGVLISTRRKPLVGVVLAILFFLMISYKNRLFLRRGVVFGVIGIIVLFGIVFQVQIMDLARSGIESYFSTESFENQARNVLYLFSGQIAFDHFPWGVGFGRFGGFISIKYYSDVYYQYGINKIWGLTGNESDASFGTDTYWPYVLGELGIIGFVLFCALLYNIFRWTVRLLRINYDVHLKSLAVAALLIFTESFLEAFASPIYANSVTIFFVFVPIALLIQMSLSSSDHIVLTHLPGVHSSELQV